MRRFAKILFLFIVGLGAGAPERVASPAEIDVSPDRRIFGYPHVPLVEPYLAVDPVHPNHLDVVLSVDGGYGVENRRIWDR